MLASGAGDQLARDLAELLDGEGEEIGEAEKEVGEGAELDVFDRLGLRMVALGVVQLAMAVAADDGERLAVGLAFDVVKFKRTPVRLRTETAARFLSPERTQPLLHAAFEIVGLLCIHCMFLSGLDNFVDLMESGQAGAREPVQRVRISLEGDEAAFVCPHALAAIRREKLDFVGAQEVPNIVDVVAPKRSLIEAADGHPRHHEGAASHASRDQRARHFGHNVRRDG